MKPGSRHTSQSSVIAQRTRSLPARAGKGNARRNVLPAEKPLC